MRQLEIIHLRSSSDLSETLSKQIIEMIQTVKNKDIEFLITQIYIFTMNKVMLMMILLQRIA